MCHLTPPPIHACGGEGCINPLMGEEQAWHPLASYHLTPSPIWDFTTPSPADLVHLCYPPPSSPKYHLTPLSANLRYYLSTLPADLVYLCVKARLVKDKLPSFTPHKQQPRLYLLLAGLHLNRTYTCACHVNFYEANMLPRGYWAGIRHVTTIKKDNAYGIKFGSSDNTLEITFMWYYKCTFT